MTAAEHIIAWIESSREHYDRLLELEALRKKAPNSGLVLLNAATLINSAYGQALQGGDCYDYTPEERAEAILMALRWKLEA